MQNTCMLLASTTHFFRVHTRVFVTLLIALSVALLCLTRPPLPIAKSLAQVATNTASTAVRPLEPSPSELPKTAIRFFFLLPHLLQ